jgi:hypothetical protein
MTTSPSDIRADLVRVAQLEAIPADRRTLARHRELEGLRNKTIRLADLIALGIMKEPA